MTLLQKIKFHNDVRKQTSTNGHFNIKIASYVDGVDYVRNTSAEFHLLQEGQLSQMELTILASSFAEDLELCCGKQSFKVI